MKFLKVSCFFFLLFLSCTPYRMFIYNIPHAGDQQYFPKACFPPSSTPRKLPIKYEALPDSFSKFLRSHHTLAFLWIQNDTVRLEYYAPQAHPSMALDLFSISKSIVAGMIAIAQEEGYISSLSEKLGDYFSDLPAGYEEITLNDLLNMRSGIKESFLITTKLYYSNHLNAAIRHIPLQYLPGQQYEYSNATTQWLIAVIEKATGTPFENYFYQKIWQPLGMENTGSWTLDSRRHHTVRGFCGLNLCLRDLARIGWCFLHEGNYFGRQIIPEEWIARTFSPPTDMKRTPDHFLYNRHWRIITPNEKFLAKGFLGQYLYIDKKTNTLLIRLGTAESSVDWLTLFEQLTRNITSPEQLVSKQKSQYPTPASSDKCFDQK